MNRFVSVQGEIKIYHFLATFTVNRSRCSNTNHLIWTGPCLVIIPSSWANVRCRWDFRQIKRPAATVLFPFLPCLKTEKYILIFLRSASFYLKQSGEENNPWELLRRISESAKLFLRYSWIYLYAFRFVGINTKIMN